MCSEVLHNVSAINSCDSTYAAMQDVLPLSLKNETPWSDKQSNKIIFLIFSPGQKSKQSIIDCKSRKTLRCINPWVDFGFPISKSLE